VEVTVTGSLTLTKWLEEENDVKSVKTVTFALSDINLPLHPLVKNMHPSIFSQLQSCKMVVHNLMGYLW